MAQNDSFIDEVSEEVRRDRLYAFFRKWGWLIALAVIVVVGGAAALEWQKARARAEAQAAGDAILDALTVEDAVARADAVATLDAGGSDGRRALLTLLAASADFEAGSVDQALAGLEALAADDAAPPVYRDLAVVKWAMIGEGHVEPQTRIDRLSALTLAGSAWRLVAEEQIALARLEMGEVEVAREVFEAILADAEAGPNQRGRIEALLVALGGTRDAG